MSGKADPFCDLPSIFAEQSFGVSLNHGKLQAPFASQRFPVTSPVEAIDDDEWGELIVAAIVLKPEFINDFNDKLLSDWIVNYIILRRSQIFH